jgi:hypothetical protein
MTLEEIIVIIVVIAAIIEFIREIEIGDANPFQKFLANFWNF